MTDGLLPDNGQADTAPVLDGQAVDAPIEGNQGQPDVQPEDPRMGIAEWMPLPENWDSMNVESKQQFKESSAYWQTAFNNHAEKTKAEYEPYKQDAEMFRNIAKDEQFRTQAFQSLGWRDTQKTPAQTAATPVAQDVVVPTDFDPYDPEQRAQWANAVRSQAEATAEKKAQAAVQPFIERYEQDQKAQNLRMQYNEVKAKHPDVDNYYEDMVKIMDHEGRAATVEDAYVLARVDRSKRQQGNNHKLPAFGDNQVDLPPEQVSASASHIQPTLSEGSDSQVTEEIGQKKGSLYFLQQAAKEGDQDAAKILHKIKR